MIPVRLRVQRFNPGKDDARKPTKDLKHPAVVNIGIAKLGPYEFHPMQGTFVYHAPKAPAATGKSVGEFLQTLSNDKKGMPLYEPEDRKFAKAAGYLWTNPALKTNKGMPIKIHFYPGGVTPARPAERAIKATQAYLTEKVGFKAGAKVDQRVPGKIYDALASVNAGKVPRQFVSIVNEDALGAAGNAHNQARHVLGGVDMPDLDAVAVRAAFGLIGGLGGHGAMYSPTSSAFKTVADADIDVGNAINNHLAPQWKKYRIKILIDGGVTLKVPRVGGQIVAFSSVGGKWAKKDVPTYLDPMSPGQKPLFYPDGRYDAWARPPLWKRLMHYLPLVGGGGGGLDAKQYNALKAQPLTQDASAGLPNVNVRIVSSDAPNTKGWFINSAYPCK